tara:strand:- start:3052 stop:4062 length:1011 start_codon:yes stop_codon:yes gene_type:complete
MKSKVFLTGGNGYIGSHICVELLERGYDITIYDNLSNSCIEVIDRVQDITNKKIKFINGDINDTNLLFKSLQGIDIVVHLAGQKAVGESNQKPVEYYINNVAGSLSLIQAMKKNNIKKIVYSSSATVYGIPKSLPIKEDHPLDATNPYGRTKLMIEDILRDLHSSDNSWNIAILRYFNPIGAHISSLIGENPNGIPNNLLPYISKVAAGNIKELNIWGADYETYDGTGVRDYLHVVDLAIGHVKAIENINKFKCTPINLGTGKGYSVMNVINTFEKITDKKIPYQIKNRREGDVAICYADPTLAKTLLGWKATKNLEDMCLDSWNWQKQNPNGYKG